MFTEEHSSSAAPLGGRYYPREASFRTSFAICHPHTRVRAEDVIKMGWEIDLLYAYMIGMSLVPSS